MGLGNKNPSRYWEITRHTEGDSFCDIRDTVSVASLLCENKLIKNHAGENFAVNFLKKLAHLELQYSN
jgi:hypothetical protein